MFNLVAASLGCNKENSEVRARHPPAVRGRGECDREGEEEEAFFGDKDLAGVDVTLRTGVVGVEVRDIVDGRREALEVWAANVCVGAPKGATVISAASLEYHG